MTPCVRFVATLIGEGRRSQSRRDGLFSNPIIPADYTRVHFHFQLLEEFFCLTSHRRSDDRIDDGLLPLPVTYIRSAGLTPGPSSPRRQDPHAFPRVRTRSTKLVGSWLYLAPFRPWVTRFATRFTRFSLVQVDR